jgi:hypothetical protein
MSTKQLETECRTYCRYLVHADPAPYVVGKYLEFHALREFRVDPFDRFLLAVSARRPFLARLADCYASRFQKTSVVRKKLVLLLALLECSAASFSYLDSPDSGGRTAAYLRLPFQGVLYVLNLMAALVVFSPVRLYLLSAGRRERNAWIESSS